MAAGLCFSHYPLLFSGPCRSTHPHHCTETHSFSLLTFLPLCYASICTQWNLSTTNIRDLSVKSSEIRRLRCRAWTDIVRPTQIIDSTLCLHVLGVFWCLRPLSTPPKSSATTAGHPSRLVAMPTETLAPALPDSKAAGSATPFSSTVPLRILNKGPDYFRRQVLLHYFRISCMRVITTIC